LFWIISLQCRWEWDEGKHVVLIIPWVWGGVGCSGKKARGPRQHNMWVAEPPSTGRRAGVEDIGWYSQLCYRHMLPWEMTPLSTELGDRDKTAISRWLSIINVTQDPVNLSFLSEALCQEQLCHSSRLPCNSRCSHGEVRRLLQKTLISADKPMFCTLLSYFM